MKDNLILLMLEYYSLNNINKNIYSPWIGLELAWWHEKTYEQILSLATSSYNAEPNKHMPL